MSNTTKHTPGPWIVDVWDYPSIPARSELCIQNKDNRIAVLSWEKDWIGPLGIKDDEAQANARLIVMAPEMLKTLTRIIEYAKAKRHHPNADITCGTVLGMTEDVMKKITSK